MDAVKNFAYSTVAVAPSPATSGPSLTVQAGQGAYFPAVPFDLTVGPPEVPLTPANSEIMRVTAVAGDVLTVTRAQYGTTAQSVAVGWQAFQGITAGLLAQIANVATSHNASATMAQNETAIFTGSTASQTLTLPASPTPGSVNRVANYSTVPVTVAPNTGQTLDTLGTTGNQTLGVNEYYEWTYLLGTWYCTDSNDPAYLSTTVPVNKGGTGNTTGQATLGYASATLGADVSLTSGTWNNVLSVSAPSAGVYLAIASIEFDNTTAGVLTAEFLLSTSSGSPAGATNVNFTGPMAAGESVTFSFFGFFALTAGQSVYINSYPSNTGITVQHGPTGVSTTTIVLIRIQ